MSYLPFPRSGVTTIPPLAGYDAFQRVRTSGTLTTLFDSHAFPSGDTTRWTSATSGGGAISTTATSTGAYVTLNSGNTASAYAVRQTWEYIPYQPGKSKLVLMSGVMVEANVADTTVRIGAFDTLSSPNGGTGDGIYFEWKNTGGAVTMNVVEAKADTPTAVNMADWNYDTMDGSGPSGLNLGGPAYFVGKAVFYTFDQEWGTGRVRFGFVMNGEFRYVHVLNHSGVGSPSSSAISSPYTTTPKLPLRFEIRKTSGTTPALMRMMSAIAQIEGGYDPTGATFGAGNQAQITIASSARYTPLFALRLKNDASTRRTTLYVTNLVAANTASSAAYRWDLFLVDASNITTFTAATPGQALAVSAAEYAVGANIAISNSGTPNFIPNGQQIASGIAVGRSAVDFVSLSYLVTPRINCGITTEATNQSRALVVFGTGITGNATAVAAMTWVEIN